MHQFILAQQPSGDWSLAGSIMTFAIPVGLFVVVAAILYFLYTRPHVTPGHRDLALVGAGAGTGASAAPAAPAAPVADGGGQAPADEASAAEDTPEGTE